MKEETYKNILASCISLVQHESDDIAKMATIACELHHHLDYFDWTGFYRVVGNMLVIGPYQGGHGCLRIAKGKGVCGEVWQTGQTQIVSDVTKHTNHIACASSTRSEIVVPVKRNGEVIAVLDVDSDTLAAFDHIDQHYLEKIVGKLT